MFKLCAKSIVEKHEVFHSEMEGAEFAGRLSLGASICATCHSEAFGGGWDSPRLPLPGVPGRRNLFSLGRVEHWKAKQLRLKPGCCVWVCVCVFVNLALVGELANATSIG
jgi:hypothetical protein